jgi:hypothetical protein
MQRRHRAQWMKRLCNAGVVDLVHNNVEVVDLRERVHLKLARPLGILPDPVYVVVYAFVILNEELV